MQVTSLAFTTDGQHLLSGDEEGTIIAWDLKQAKRVHSSKAHSGPVWSLAVSHGSGAILASGKTPRGTCKAAPEDHASSVSQSAASVHGPCQLLQLLVHTAEPA